MATRSTQVEISRDVRGYIYAAGKKPDNPTAGNIAIFHRADGVYTLTSAGVETKINAVASSAATLHDFGLTAAIAVKTADNGAECHVEGGKGFSFDTANLADNNQFFVINTSGADQAGVISFTGFAGVYDRTNSGAAVLGPLGLEKDNYKRITVAKNGTLWYANITDGNPTAISPPENTLWKPNHPYAAFEVFQITIPSTGTYKDNITAALDNSGVYEMYYPTAQTSGAVFDTAESTKALMLWPVYPKETLTYTAPATVTLPGTYADEKAINGQRIFIKMDTGCTSLTINLADPTDMLNGVVGETYNNTTVGSTIICMPTAGRWECSVMGAGGGSAETIQKVSENATITEWNSVVIIGETDPTADMTLILPKAKDQVGKTIKFIRVDATDFKVSLESAAGESLALANFGTELDRKNGAIEVQVITSTMSRQTSNLSFLGDSVQSISATGKIKNWGSVVMIGTTAPTEDMTLTLPSCLSNIGRTIKLVRIDATTHKVTLAAASGETLTLLSSGGELNTQNGSVTLESVSVTASRQVGQVAASNAVAETSQYYLGRVENQAGDTGHSWTEMLKLGSDITTSDNITFTLKNGKYEVFLCPSNHYAGNAWRHTMLQFDGVDIKGVYSGSDGSNWESGGGLIWNADATSANKTIKVYRKGSTSNGNIDMYLRIVKIPGSNLFAMPAGSAVLTPRNVTGSATGTGYDDKPIPFLIPLSAGNILDTVTATGGAVVSNINPLTGTFNLTVKGANSVISHTTIVAPAVLLMPIIQTANAGVAVSYGTLAFQMAASGNRSLQIRSNTGANLTVNANAVWNGSVGSQTIRNLPITSAAWTYIESGWNSGAAGDILTALIQDVTNSRWYEAKMTTGASYVSNVFSIREIPGFYFAPSGMVVYTQRNITGSVTGVGYQGIEAPFNIPLATGKILDTVSLNGTPTTKFNPLLGVVWITPGAIDIAVTHTVKDGKTFQGRYTVGRYRPTTPQSIEALIVNTGIDMRTAQYLTIYVRDDSASSVDGVSAQKSPAAMHFNLAQLRANSNTGFGVLYDTGYMEFRIRDLATGQIFFEDVNRGVDLVEVLVEDDGVFNYSVPTGTVSRTACNVSVNSGANQILFGGTSGRIMVTVPANQMIDVAGVTQSAGLTVSVADPFSGSLEVAVVEGTTTGTITVPFIAASDGAAPDFTDAGGNTGYGIVIPYRAHAKLNELRFTLYDRRGGGLAIRTVDIVVPVSYIVPFTNNGWTAEFSSNIFKIYKDFTMTDSAVYRCYIGYIATPSGHRFYFEDTHSNTGNTYGAVKNIKGIFI